MLHAIYITVTSTFVAINTIGLYKAMIGRLRQLSGPRQGQDARIEKSHDFI